MSVRASICSVFSLLAVLAACADSDTFPSRPVTLIVPWAAGGGTDRLARQIAVGLEERLGVPVNVVNAVGGGGVTGHLRGAIARPDGYTLTLATAELNMLHWRELTTITHHDFEPLLLVNRDDAALFVRAEAPWRTSSELAAAIRDQPRTLRGSGTAFGGIWHLAVAGWLHAQGIPGDALIWVAINGAAPSFQEMLAGRLDLVATSLPEARPLLNGGLIRPLAIMSDARSPEFPDVPTVGEDGVPWSMGTWRGVVLPRGVPRDRVQVLQDALEDVVHDEAFRDFMAFAGFSLVLAAGADFGAMLEETDIRLGEVLNGPAFATLEAQRFGPMFFPAVTAVLLLIALGVAIATRAFRADSAIASLSRADWARAGSALVWAFAYVALWELVGFVVATVAVLGTWLFALRVRWTVAVPLTIGVAVGVYHAFAVLLRVPLPWGWVGW